MQEKYAFYFTSAEADHFIMEEWERKASFFKHLKIKKELKLCQKFAKFIFFISGMKDV